MKHVARNQIGEALKLARSAKNLSQEAFALVSSRTYVSTLERGLKSPTLSKIEDLASVLQIHPLALLTMAYMDSSSEGSAANLHAKVDSDLRAIFADPELIRTSKK